MNLRKVWLGLAATTVLTAGAVVPAGAAHAAVPGIEVVQGHSSTGHPDWNRAYATCPTGKVAIGGGGDLVGGGHGVRLGDASVYSNTFEASAAANSAGYTSDWTLYAYAVCANPPAGLARPDSSAVYTPRTDVETVNFYCPTGTKLLSPGVWLNYQEGRVFLSELRPFDDLSGFTATIHDDGPPAIGLTIGSSALCASPLSGLQLVRASTTATSADKTAGVECPTGKRTIGVGGSVSGDGHEYLDRMVPHGSAWTGADIDVREDLAGTTNTWSATVYAICASS